MFPATELTSLYFPKQYFVSQDPVGVH